MPIHPTAAERQVGHEVRFKFLLGVAVKNIIDGFTGVVTQRNQMLNGCLQYCVKPQSLKADGDARDPRWYDEEDLEYIDEGVRERLYGKPIKTKTAGPPGANGCYPPSA